MGDNRGSRFELAQQDWTKPHVNRRRQVQHDRRSLVEIGLKQIFLNELDAIRDARRPSILLAFADAFRVNIDSDPARTVMGCGGYDDAPVATPEVVHHAVF